MAIEASLEKMRIIRTGLAGMRRRDEGRLSGSESGTILEILYVGRLLDNGNKVSLYDSWLMSHPGPEARLSYFPLT